LFDVLPHDGNRRTATTGGEVGRRPQHAFPIALLDVRPFLPQQATGDAFDAVHEIGDSHLGRVFHKQVNVIVLAVHLDQLRLEVGADLGEDRAQPVDGVAIEYPAAIFRYKDQMDMHLKNAVSSMPNLVCRLLLEKKKTKHNTIRITLRGQHYTQILARLYIHYPSTTTFR